MTVGPITGFQPFQPTPIAKPEAAPASTGFADRIGAAVENLAASQTKAAESAKAFELGKTSDLASVMVDQQISSLGFQFALNVRNKALTAYRDIMNMPV